MAEKKEESGRSSKGSQANRRNSESDSKRSGNNRSSGSDRKEKSQRNKSAPDSKDSNERVKPGSVNPRSRKKAEPPPKETGWFGRIGSITSSALKMARRTTDSSVKVGRTILKSQDQLKLMVAAGQSLKDLREVAGLTVTELGDALNLKDKTFWEAVENGTATISFELILRLAALLARNDPVPFILKYTRTYNPELWKFLNDWGLGRLPLHYEREREFINIYRRHDVARHLSDEGFKKVLGFTRQAFEMGLHFAVEQEDNIKQKVKAEKETRKETESAKNRDEKTDNPASSESSATQPDDASESSSREENKKGD